MVKNGNFNWNNWGLTATFFSFLADYGYEKMKKIEELVKNVKQYKDIIIQIDFDSKKNTVSYVTVKGKPRVLKWYVPGLKSNMKREYDILKNASKELNVPNVYEMDEENNVLVLSYIIGENLCDLINDEKTSKSEKQTLIVLLSDWFSKFHQHYKKDNEFRIRGDSTLRNFIFTDKIWGVDFEESRVGKPVEDIACMCASILSTDPMFTSEKFELCEKFIDSYGKNVPWRLNDIADEISYALLERIQWRPEQEEILRKYSKKIREKGL